MKTKFLLVATALLFALGSFAQDLSNMGTDFWTGFGYHARMKDNEAFLSIYIAAGAKAATVRVSLPGVADPTFPKTVNVAPNTTIEVTNFPIGDPGDEFNEAGLPDSRLYYTGLSKRGIHIESLNGAPVAVFEHTYGQDAAGASMLFPVNTWGASYNVLTIGGTSNSGVANSFFFIMAAEDNTVVEITPSVPIQDSSKASIFKDDNNGIYPVAGGKITITLNKGEVFNAMSTVVSKIAGDLTGTYIKSTDCVNKKIMVVAGNGRTFVNTNGCNRNQGSDNLLQQMLPRVAWGTTYLTTPTKTMEYGVYRICVQDPATNVTVNGVPIAGGLVGGFYYQIEGNGFMKIESDKPIMVVQYIITGGCKVSAQGNNGQGDPEMIILSPVQQAVKSASVFSASKRNISAGASYINVIIHKNGVSSFNIDGRATVDTGNSSFTGAVYGSSPLVPLASAFRPHPADPDYVFARFKVQSGISHTLSSDSGFNAIAYGMVQGESYGYNAGTLIKDLTAIITTNNPYGSVLGATTCPGNAANLEIAVPYLRNQVNGLLWSPFTPGITPAAPSPATEAASWVRSYVQGVTTYNVYKSPVAYTMGQTGTYRINVTVTGTFSSECGGTQVIPIDVLVVKDTVDYTITPDGCGSPNVVFADISKPYSGTTISKWIWDFDDATPDYTGTTPATKNPPKHNYAALNIYNVKLSVINSLGCISDTIQKIDLSAGLQAKFSISPKDTVCPGTELTFTDMSSSSGASGTVNKWTWSYKKLPSGPATALPDAKIVKKTFTDAEAGTYEISLQVNTTASCPSNVVKDTFYIAPTPVPNFTLPGGVCIPGSTLFKNTSTIADTTLPTVTYVWNFGDGPATTTDFDGTHIYNAAPPNPPGAYDVSLTATSKFGCTSAAKVQQVKDVFSPPVADFKLPTGSEVCLNSDSSFVSTSTATGGQTFSNYAWDFGDGSAVQSGANLQTVKHLFDIEGSKDVKLVVTTNKGCIDSITQPINVATPPVADFTWSANTCVGNEVTFTDASGPVGVVKSWSWKFGDNTTSADQSPLHTYTQSGPVKPILQVFTAAGCPSKPDTNDLVINPSPVTDFTLPLGICVPGSTTFVNTTTISDGTLGTVTYLWDFDDAGSTSTDVDGVHIYTGAKPGGYNVKLTATSINGCFDDTVKNVIDVFEPPVAIFTIDRTALCEKQSVIFTNASTAAGNQRVNQWEWVFGDNSPNGTDSIVSHPYDAFASYDATLTVTTDKGCVSTISAPQTITVNQNPIVSYPGHPGICLEAVARPLTPATDASETTGLPGSFTYSGAGVESDGGGGYQFNPATSGGSNLNGYPVQALYITGDGCRDSATSPMKVFPTPVANWQTGSPACEQNGVGFTDASDAGYGKIITWKWDMLGDGNLDIRGNGASFSYTYPQADTFNVSLQVLTDSGCTSAITTIPLAVNYLPRVDVAIPGALCLPDATGTFKDMSTIPDGTENQFKYKWDFGDGSSSLQKDPSHTYHAAGASPYKIQLTVTSGNGCVDSLPQRIALTNMYPPPVAEFEAAPSEVCQGESMQFTDKSNGVTSPVNKWFWRFGDGGIDSVASLSHTFGRANYFDVKLTVTNGEGCSASSTRRVKVNAYPRIEMPDNVYIKPGTSTVLRPQVSAINSTNVSYSWTPGLYLDRTDIKNPVSEPPADQVYVLTVVAGTGCSSTDSIKVNLLMDLKPPNAFSPNGDGINDTWRIPNLEFYAGCEVEVFDRYGKIAYKTTGYSKAWDGTTGGKQLPTGVYYYIINPKNGYEKFTGSVTILR